MGKVYLDDSFDGKKMEYIELEKKMNVNEMIKQIMEQIEEKLKKRRSQITA